MILYTYFRSSASYRVRIALNLKQLAPEFRFVHLRRREHHAPEYARLNPMREVPTLEDGEHVIGQSMAIMEYIEEVYPEPPLLPPDPYRRALVRQMCEVVNSGIHPICNLKVLQYLERLLGADEEQQHTWYRHWVGQGLEGLEQLVARHAGTYCVGDAVTLADVLLVPQLYNAQRWEVDLSACPTLLRVRERCEALPAFQQAHPDRQEDAQA